MRATDAFGALFLALGLLTLLWPEVFSIAYGLDLSAPPARHLFLSLVSGTELGLGAILILGPRYGLCPGTLLWVCAVIFASLACLRLGQGLFSATWHLVGGIEMILEAALACIAASCAPRAGVRE